MSLDHIAFRVAQGKRDETMKFFVDAFGYKIQGDPFEIYFNDEHTDKAMCVALEPPEKLTKKVPWAVYEYDPDWADEGPGEGEFHMAPELFISEGSPGSIVHEWVQSRAGVGGIHHLAYQVDDVESTMKKWIEKGWAKFASEKPVTCPGITQVFSKPNCTGVIFEFINRGSVGFCADNVKKLMNASKGD